MSTDSPDTDLPRLPEELPPVQPPSAGFIAQLFLVPGLIVLAIIIVWTLVSRMASIEQDWRTLVLDIQSPHPHVRSRAIFGLAQQLSSEQNSTSPAPKLCDNADVAQQLSDLLQSELKRSSSDDAAIQQQAILAQTLSLFHVHETVLPVLIQAIQPEHDEEVRTNALKAIAVIAGRAFQEQTPIKAELAEDPLIAISSDPTPLIRQMAAYILGLIPSKASRGQLKVLIENSDSATRLNAAIGLARQGSTEGYQVIVAELREADRKTESRSNEEVLLFTRISNSLKALQQVGDALSAEQRDELRAIVKPISTDFREVKLRMEARQLLTALGEADAKANLKP
jgi:HEAT repeat protein